MLHLNSFRDVVKFLADVLQMDGTITRQSVVVTVMRGKCGDVSHLHMVVCGTPPKKYANLVNLDGGDGQSAFWSLHYSAVPKMTHARTVDVVMSPVEVALLPLMCVFLSEGDDAKAYDGMQIMRL
jgi:hypothetical protein